MVPKLGAQVSKCLSSLVGAGRFELPIPVSRLLVGYDRTADRRSFSCKSRRLRAPDLNLHHHLTPAALSQAARNRIARDNFHYHV
jgi:hypothetical protein